MGVACPHRLPQEAPPTGVLAVRTDVFKNGDMYHGSTNSKKQWEGEVRAGYCRLLTQSRASIRLVLEDTMKAASTWGCGAVRRAVLSDRAPVMALVRCTPQMGVCGRARTSTASGQVRRP